MAVDLAIHGCKFSYRNVKGTPPSGTLELLVQMARDVAHPPAAHLGCTTAGKVEARTGLLTVWGIPMGEAKPQVLQDPDILGNTAPPPTFRATCGSESKASKITL